MFVSWIAHRFSFRGDTIVEVLIAIAVLSLVLGGAFVATNRSLQGTRDAQERINALKLAETQIEQLKAMSADDDVGVADQPFNFSGTGCTRIDPSSGTLEVTTTASECIFTAGGDANPGAVEPAFHVEVTRAGDGATSPTTTFTVRNWWNGATGDSTPNSVDLEYRIYR